MASFKDFIVDLFGNAKDSEGNLLNTVLGKESADIYYKELAIALCVNLIANSLSECTIRTYKNGVEVFDMEHYILNIRPNINENSSVFFHKAVEKMVYNGEALIVNLKDNLYVADSYSVEYFPLKGNVYSNIRIDNLNLNNKFRQDDVILLKLNNVNIKKLIDDLYKSYGELLKYCIEKYKLDNQEKYVLELDNVKVGDKLFNEKFKGVIQEQLQDFLNNPKTVLPLYKGQTLTDVSKSTTGNSSGDLQSLIEQLFRMVSQAFNIPIDLLFSRTNNNVSQVVTQFLTFCINPVACMIEEELSAKLYDGFKGFSQGNYIRVDTSDIRHINILEVAQAVDKILASGVLNINELRKLVGYNEIDEEFANKHWMTKNYSLAEGMTVDTNIVENEESEKIITDNDNMQQTALNGAQIESLLSIVNAVVNGTMDYEGAIVLISSAFPFDENIARKILGDIANLKSQEEIEKEFQEGDFKIANTEKEVKNKNEE